MSVTPSTSSKVQQTPVKTIGSIPFPPRKVWIKTFGCQMNYHDTERILSHLTELNFTETKEQNEADLLLFNSCAIRDLSNMKFYSQLGETKHRKGHNCPVDQGASLIGRDCAQGDSDHDCEDDCRNGKRDRRLQALCNELGNRQIREDRHTQVAT